MDRSKGCSSVGPVSRRRFLTGAAAGAGMLALSDRLAFAQSMLSGPAPLTVHDIQGWGQAPGVVDIGDNENPYGPSPAAVRAVAGHLLDVNRYDFESARNLADAIGRYHGMAQPPPATNRFAPSGYPVYVEGGSSFILQLVAQRFGIRGGGGEIVEAEPGYGGVTRFISAYRDRFGAEIAIRRVPTTADFKHDLDAMLDAVTADTTLVIITNPNNPTGTIVPHAEIERFVAAVPGHVTVMIDEAYIHFVREPGYQDSAALALRYDNVVVTRTFSKIFGLAGLRVGYAIANKDAIDELRFFGNGGGIGSLNCYAAVAALQDRAFVRHVRRMTDQVKDDFYAELDRLGLAYVPSHSSFVLVDAGQDGAALAQRLEARGILVSRLGMDGNRRMQNFVRFTMGTPEEVRVALGVLREELAA